MTDDLFGSTSKQPEKRALAVKNTLKELKEKLKNGDYSSPKEKSDLLFNIQLFTMFHEGLKNK